MDGKQGTLVKCYLAYDAWLTCSAHAFSTEKQEVMGLLLGRWAEDGTVAIVDSALVLARSDRQKDRVEVGYEQLAAASELAEQRENRTGRECRVIGWYHSHPHITVQPSHVDVRTQGQYQAMDSGFLGLIFSCFSQDSTSYINRVEVTAFQANGTHSKSNNDEDFPSTCTCGDDSISSSIASAVLSGAQLNQPGSFGIQRRKRCPVNTLPLNWSHQEVSLQVCQYPDDQLNADLLNHSEKSHLKKNQNSSSSSLSSTSTHTNIMTNNGAVQTNPHPSSSSASPLLVASSVSSMPPDATSSNLVISTPVMLTPDSLTSSPRSIPPASTIRQVSALSSSVVPPKHPPNGPPLVVAAASSLSTSPLPPSMPSPLIKRKKASLINNENQKVDHDDDVYFLSSSDALRGLVRLQQVLMEEEKASYIRSIIGSITQTSDDISDQVNSMQNEGKVNSLHILHNSAIYQKSLCNIFEELVRPVEVLIESTDRRYELEREELEEENRRLKEALAEPLTPQLPQGTTSSGVDVPPPPPSYESVTRSPSDLIEFTPPTQAQTC